MVDTITNYNMYNPPPPPQHKWMIEYYTSNDLKSKQCTVNQKLSYLFVFKAERNIEAKE